MTDPSHNPNALEKPKGRPKGSTHGLSQKAGEPIRVVQLMNKFLREYDAAFGNISVAAANTPVSRKAVYRWLNGTSKLHKRFQKRLVSLRSRERMIDLAEGVMVNQLIDGSLDAAKFTLKMQGKPRGWAENHQVEIAAPINKTAAEAAVRSFRLWLADHPDATETDTELWLGRFAKVAGLSVDDVERTMKIMEIEGR